MQESNIIKDFLFEYITNSEKKLQELASHSKFAEIIEDIIENCFEKITGMGEKEESIGTFAIGLLHYIFTTALISSQRKVEFQGIELDIVIPNLKTLKNDPKKALIICIPKTTDTKLINQKLQILQKIQPYKENIWLVLSKELDFQNKMFIINKKDKSFSKIVYEVAQFVNVNEQNKFKILRI